MVTATKTSINSTTKSIDILSKVSNTNIVSKSAAELYKADNSKTTSKSKTSKSEDFKDVLSSKTKSKDTAETTDTTKADELKEKLEELEEDSKSDSKDDISGILNELLNLLTKLGVKEEDLKSMIDKINGDKSSNNNLNSVMEKLLKNLSDNLADDNAEGIKDIKSSIKNLMSEISNILDNKQNQSGKVLTLEDMLNKNYSQDNKENSNESQSNKNDTSQATKEDKFLNSLINDDKDSSLNKINLYASRTQIVQNQGVDTVRGLTINKATFADDLIKDVKFMSNNGLKELTVKINPGNLGEITIKLIEEDGVMKANLKANSKETTALLSQNLVDIKKQLGEQNIKIADVNIELYQEDTTYFKEQGFGRQFSEEQGRKNNSNSNTVNNAAIIEDDLTDTIELNDSNIDIHA